MFRGLRGLRQTLKRPAPFTGFAPAVHSATLAPASARFDEAPFSIQSLPQRSGSPQPKDTLDQGLAMMNSSVDSFKHDPLKVLRWTMEMFNGQVAMSTSFGIQSAVLLHMATQVKPDIPVVWVDTGYLPKETYEYAEQLRDVLNLNLIVKTNEEWSPARMEAVYGKLWERDDAESHALYGRLRKVEPLKAGLESLEPNPQALLSGLRASQTKARANMLTVGFQSNRFKVLPMLKMTDEDVANYMDKFDLPRHPLEAQGYATVGDWHSSRPVQQGEDARNTRFGGKFQECGLHVDESEPEQSATTVGASDVQQLASFTATGVEALQSVKAHSDTDTAVVVVKKIMEDGSYCRKCNDVAKKMQKDDVEKWVGYTGFADMRDMDSEGIKLAKHFEIVTAPFFLVRSREEEEQNKEWRVVRSYLQLKKMLLDAAEKKQQQSL